jgi:hypothetical protein
MPDVSHSSRELNERYLLKVGLCVMRSFGRRPNSADFAHLMQFGRRPISCRVLERSLRVIRILVSEPRTVAQSFTLVLNNGNDRVFCQVLSYGDDFVMARYTSRDSADLEIGLTHMGASLSEAERWKGAA